MSINLADLDAAKACDAAFELELKHPVSNVPLGLFVSHKGISAPAVQKASRAQVNQALLEGFRAQRKNDPDAAAPTIEKGEKRTAKTLAVATVDWYEKDAKGDKVAGWPFGDERLMFSPEAAEKLYANPSYDWITAQLDKSAAELGNFLKG